MNRLGSSRGNTPVLRDDGSCCGGLGIVRRGIGVGSGLKHPAQLKSLRGTEILSLPWSVPFKKPKLQRSTLSPSC